MSGVCSCTTPHYPCFACGAGMGSGGTWHQWPPTPIVATTASSLVTVNVDQLYERVRKLERGLRAIGGHLGGDGSGDDEIRRIIQALDVE